MIRYYKKNKELLIFWGSVLFSFLLVGILYSMGYFDITGAICKLKHANAAIKAHPMEAIVQTTIQTAVAIGTLWFFFSYKNKKGCYGN